MKEPKEQRCHNSIFCSESGFDLPTSIQHDFSASDDPDCNGQSVRNEVCACRGDAGCFHVSCLMEFAKTKTKAAMDRCLDVNLGEIW
eukprot:scaffold174530_cov36-Cyclotella_meneghiniana.AAC.1